MSDTFPQYRKYNNGKSVFKVESADKIVELQQIGNRVVAFEIVANQFPEKLWIRDILELEHPLAVASSEAEFEAWLNRVDQG